MESVFKKVEFTFGSFNRTALPLDQKILVVGSMSVISAGGFENCLTGVLESSHNAHFSIKPSLNQMIGFKKDLNFKAKQALQLSFKKLETAQIGFFYQRSV